MFEPKDDTRVDTRVESKMVSQGRDNLMKLYLNHRDTDQGKALSKYTSYFRLLVYARPSAFDVGLLLVAVSAAIATGVPLPLLAILFGQLIDDFNVASCSSNASSEQDSAYQSDINGRIRLLVYIAIAQFVFIYVHLVCWSLVGSRLTQRIRERYLQSLLRQEPSFFDNFKEGEVSSRLNGDIQAIRSGTSEKVGICIATVSCLIGAYVVAFIKYSKLAGILTCLIPAYLIMAIGGSYYIERYSGQLSNHVAAAASIASEALSHVQVVHAFGASTRLEASMTTELDKAKAAGARKAIATGGQAGLMYFIAYAANGLAFWQGSKAIADAVRGVSAGMSVGAIFTVIFVVVDATVALSQVAPFLQVFAAASAAFMNLERDIERASHIDPSSSSGLTLSETSGYLEFCNVSFAYPSRADVPVIRHVSLQIPAGKHTAIVGPSGSGKSTIAGLIMRLYDPEEGTIKLDTQGLKQLNVRSLRSYVSLAQQEGALLDRSILENIAYGLVNSDQARWKMTSRVLQGAGLKNAAASLREGQKLDLVISNAESDVAAILKMVVLASKHAEAHEFVTKLQHSYGTMAGPEGQFLSGGQKQRIALARALIKDPKILILDEATSALDSATERRVTATLAELVSGKTLISIAHRLSTIQNADKIVVMKAGEVVEEGTHSELMTADGTYANMVRLQSMGSVTDNESTIGIDTGSSDDIRTHTDLQKGQISHSVEEKTIEPASNTVAKITEDDHTATEDENAALIVDKSFSNIGRVFGRITRPYLLMVLPALIATTIVGAAFTIEAVIFGNTVGNLSPCKEPTTIASKGAFFGLMFFVLAIAEFFANLASWSFFGYVSESIVRTSRILCFRVLFIQDLQWHQSAGRTPASLLNFITRDGDLVAGLSGSVLGVLFSIAVNLVLSIVFTTIVAWKIALVCLAIVPLFLGIGIMQLRVAAKYEERNESAYTTSVSIGVEAVSNIKTVAALSLEDDTLALYRNSLAGPQKETAQASMHANIWLALAYFVGNLGYALAFWWGGKQIVNGTYSQVQFLIVVFSLLVSAQLWSGMFALAPEITSAKAALARISSLLKLEPDRISSHPKAFIRSSPSDDDAERGSNEKGSQSSNSSSTDQAGLGVSLQNVVFSYPSRPGVQVLKSLSLSIIPGQFCALVGSSGAGKSTIVGLIERMYTPESGSILVGHRDITKTTSVSFRDEIAYVPQNSALFDGSISFNIGLGARPGTVVSDAEIVEACKITHIHETVATLPEGYNTRVGNSGGQLSGGQRQRLAIARALVRKPRLLILDEPTSALDAETENVLQEGLTRVMHDLGMTVIVIAHRLKTIRRADVIYMLDQGRVVGQGTHEELLKDSQIYRENVASQTMDL